MNLYSTDRQWADLYIPEIARIVGPYLLVSAPFEIDTRQAADLITLKARDLTVACRVRRPANDYLHKYGWQFTIRCQRDSGAKTELAKITEGWGDWMFYGFAASNDPANGFARWSIIDLSAWRAHMIRRNESIRQGKKANGDGTYFAWFDLRSFPADPPVTVATSEHLPPLAGGLPPYSD